MKRLNWHFIIGLLIITFSLAACSDKSATEKKVAKTVTAYDQEENENNDSEEEETEYLNIDAEDIMESEVDSMVLVVFEELYPTATDANWAQDANEYIVSFMENDYSLKATFEEGGDWMQTVTDIEFEDLPIDAQTHITKKYKVEQYNHIVKVEIPEEVSYFVTFETEKAIVVLTFGEAGKLEEKEIEAI